MHAGLMNHGEEQEYALLQRSLNKLVDFVKPAKSIFEHDGIRTSVF